MTVIGLTGYAQSGKDTVGHLLEKYGFERLAFADALRTGLLGVDPWINLGPDYEGTTSGLWERLHKVVELYGWDVAKTSFPEVRRLMQAYGTEGGRDIHGQECWADIIRRQLQLGGSLERFVITDVRFPNEVELVHTFGGSVWRIDRPGTEAVNAHVSDDVGRLNVDTVISNDGSLQELAAEVDRTIGGLL